MPTRTFARTTAVTLFENRRGDAEPRPTAVTADVLDDPDFGMFAALRIDAHRMQVIPDDAPPQTWLLADDGSWAYATFDDGEPVTGQAGPTRLWDLVEAALADWDGLSHARRDRLGLTVQPDGQHVLWHDRPDAHQWPISPSPPA